MMFTEVLDQVIELLQRQERVSYRALKTEFDLDDAYIEELQAEIIQAQGLAVDENGVALVWNPARRPDGQSDPLSLQPSTPEAERRQLSVMCCHVVVAPTASEHAGATELHEILSAYRKACHEVIGHFDGYLAEQVGDGLLAYFGYPQAHEDDAQRAVRAGLGMMAAIEQLNTRLRQEKGLQLALRIGIHTDLAVIRGGGEREGSALTVVGEASRTAAWLQELTTQNTLAISTATYRLVHGYFVCHDLGVHRLKALSTPVHVYCVLSESNAQSRLDVVAPTGLTPLVGRQQEVQLLQERWAQAQQGRNHVVFLSGEIGIGKSRLVHVMKEHVAGAPHVQWECRCSPHYHNTAFYPVIDGLERTLRFTTEDSPEEKLHKLETACRSHYDLELEETVPPLASLLALALPQERYAPLPLTPQQQRQKTLEGILTILAQMACRQPVLLIIEDLQWIDASTLELLELIITHETTARMLTLLTARPDFEPPWSDQPHVTRLALQGLSGAQVEQMATQVAGGKALPDEMRQHLVTKTDGVPLFVEELTKMMLESFFMQEQGDRYALMGSLPATTIPTTLRGSLMARLDQSAAGKAVARLGATLGRTFSSELLRAVSPFDEMTLQQGLRQLVEAEMLYQHGTHPHTTYVFKHALIQDVAYQSLLQGTRQRYHERIAQVLANRSPEIAATQPELLAHHLMEAGLSADAIPYWLRAAQRAIMRSAHVETIGHLIQGLALVTTLPDTSERTQHELTFQLTLGNTLVKLKGYGAPEVGQAYAQARALCQEISEPRHLARALYGLWVFYLTRAESQTAYELAEQLLALAQSQHNPDSILRGHNALGTTLCFLGQFDRAYRHLKQGMACEAPRAAPVPASTDAIVPQVANFAYASWTLWYMGYADQALAAHQAAEALAQERQHPFSLAIAHFYGAVLYQLRCEPDAARQKAEAAIALATELAFPVWVAGGTLVRGWALVAQGQYEAGLAQIQEGLAIWSTTGAELIRPSGLAKLAEAYEAVGQPEKGLDMLAEALAAGDTTGMRYYEAELYRLQGRLLLVPGARQHAGEAEASLQRALAVARSQGAKALELRAAVSLSALWQQQGKRAAAHQLLAPIYGWFSEGFDTADLQEAKALLETLA